MKYLNILVLALLAACSSASGPSHPAGTGTAIKIIGPQPWVGDSMPGDSLLITLDFSHYFSLDSAPEDLPTTIHVDSIVPCHRWVDTLHNLNTCDLPDSLHLSGHISQLDSAGDGAGHVTFVWTFGPDTTIYRDTTGGVTGNIYANNNFIFPNQGLMIMTTLTWIPGRGANPIHNYGPVDQYVKGH